MMLIKPKNSQATESFLQANAAEKSFLSDESSRISSMSLKTGIEQIKAAVNHFNSRASIFNENLKNSGGQSGAGFRLFMDDGTYQKV